MRFLGIDGCKSGWLIASSGHFPLSVEYEVQPDLQAVFDQARRREVIAAIDIPIGLSSNALRTCEVVARTHLSPSRKSCVFPSPSRTTIDATTYDQARHLYYRACGKRITKQLFGILHKIREVDGLIEPELQGAIRETHPEVVFAVLGGVNGAPRLSKHSPDGQQGRLAILSRYFPELDADSIRRARSRVAREVGTSRVSIDDVLDALACLLVSHWICNGQARSLSVDISEFDDRGLRMEIVIPPINA
jgi:predicted RNase H-like nuclease